MTIPDTFPRCPIFAAYRFWPETSAHIPDRPPTRAKEQDWKDVFGSGPDGLRALVQQVVQEVLEAEMDDTVAAHKSERTPDRQGYRSGYYTRTFVTRVGKLVLRGSAGPPRQI